ncbi:MAG TPA: NAD-dependent epimerase/dehydratase family protein [Polyangiaceae bacterium]
MRVLVVGGTGFIGAPTVRQLVAGGHDVAVLHRGERTAPLPKDVESIVAHRDRLADHAGRLRAWRPEVVVDFIAFAEPDVRAVHDALRGVARRLVVLSSLDVYRAYDRLMRVQPGPPERTPIREEDPLREVPFPRRKWASGPDDVMWSYDKIPVERATLSDPELPGTVLRLPAVYGPGDRRRHRVGRYLESMGPERDTLELDAALASWSWTRGYVEDVACAIALATLDARAAGRIYNVGEDTPLTEGAWVRAIALVAAYAGTVVERKREDLPEDVARDLDERDFAHDLVLDTTRIQAELGWRPRASLDEALAASIAWEQQVAASQGQDRLGT